MLPVCIFTEFPKQLFCVIRSSKQDFLLFVAPLMFRWTVSRLKTPERTRVRILPISVRVAPFHFQMFHCEALPLQVRLCTHSQLVLGSNL